MPDQRVTLPWRPLPPIGAGLFGTRWLWLACLWIGLPLTAAGMIGAWVRRWIEASTASRHAFRFRCRRIHA
uniref:Transmembrane protein n=1 Tax=Ralstonia solanacearum TaxID=305 RepID=A0A0S4TW70_RALSL|nr:conserved protein of unknown function [Ralstonia solanacearum]